MQNAVLKKYVCTPGKGTDSSCEAGYCTWTVVSQVRCPGGCNNGECAAVKPSCNTVCKSENGNNYVGNCGLPRIAKNAIRATNQDIAECPGNCYCVIPLSIYPATTGQQFTAQIQVPTIDQLTLALGAPVPNGVVIDDKTTITFTPQSQGTFTLLSFLFLPDNTVSVIHNQVAVS